MNLLLVEIFNLTEESGSTSTGKQIVALNIKLRTCFH